jgi:hypothetical protein
LAVVGALHQRDPCCMPVFTTQQCLRHQSGYALMYTTNQEPVVPADRGHGDHYQQPQQQPSPSTCPSERRGLLRSTSSPWVPSTPPPPGAAGGPAVSTMGLKVIHEGQPSVTSPTGPGSAPSGRSGSFVRPSGGSMTAAATPAAAAAGGGAAAKPSTAASLLKAASGRLRRSSHADEAAANGDKAAAGSGAPPVTRTASGIARKVSGSAGGPGIGMASAAHAGADDPLLQPEVLETVNIRVRGEKVRCGVGGGQLLQDAVLLQEGCPAPSLCLLAALLPHPAGNSTVALQALLGAVQAPSVMLVSLRVLRRLTLPHFHYRSSCLTSAPRSGSGCAPALRSRPSPPS